MQTEYSQLESSSVLIVHRSFTMRQNVMIDETQTNINSAWKQLVADKFNIGFNPVPSGKGLCCYYWFIYAVSYTQFLILQTLYCCVSSFAYSCK